MSVDTHVYIYMHYSINVIRFVLFKNKAFMSTVMEQIQSTNIYQINDNGISDATMCNSRLRLSDNIPIRKSKLRSSPPPLSPVTSVFDESDEEDSWTIIEEPQKNDLTNDRPSLPKTNLGYNRKKSHSVKLTRHDGIHSCPKKAVRFADDFGLELCQMKMINTDELPFIPNEAFKHLHVNHEHQEHMKTVTYMDLQFGNPMYTQDFNNRLSQQKIVLEQASKFSIH